MASTTDPTPNQNPPKDPSEELQTPLRDPIFQDLTRKQEMFLREYTIDYNGSRAAIAAGYSKKTAREMAHENLTKPHILTALRAYQKQRVQALGITEDRILEAWSDLAFTPLPGIIDFQQCRMTVADFSVLSQAQKMCIKKFRVKTTQEMEYDPDSGRNIPVDVQYVEIELYDRQKALDALSKYHGMFVERAELKMPGVVFNLDMRDPRQLEAHPDGEETAE